MNRRVLSAILLFLGCVVPVAARQPNLDRGSTGLALALRRLPQTGSLLHITAHPDDEDNALLVLLRRGRGFRTGLLTLTRGDGGQNEIGPELFQALGIIRTGELMASHQYDDVRQFFTRAYEFGYSFSSEETLERWGEEPILGDMVRVIRAFRPRVILSLPRSGEGGGQHHQASALLAEKAFYSAADPGRFPEQLLEGLRPWQADRLYERYRWEGSSSDPAEPRPSGVVEVETGGYDPILGQTFAQLGSVARSMHRCQGMGQLEAPPGPHSSMWNPVDLRSVETGEGVHDLFEGMETGLQAVAGYARTDVGRLPFLVPALEQIQSAAEAAARAFDPARPALVAPFVAKGLSRLRLLRGEFYRAGLSERDEYDIFFLLERKEEDFLEALQLAHQLTLEVLVDDGRVVPGQDVEATVVLFNGGSEPVEIEGWEMGTPGHWQGRFPGGDLSNFQLASGGVRTFKLPVRVSDQAAVTEPYWSGPLADSDRYRIQGEEASSPWGPPELTVSARYRSFGVTGRVQATAEYAYPGPWVGGEQRHDLMVVPRVSVSVEPGVSVLPLEAAKRGRELRVEVTHNGKQAGSGRVRLEVPQGWRSVPASRSVRLDREEESSVVAFTVFPPARPLAGGVEIQAAAEWGGMTFRRGFQVIDYDHIRRRHLYHPASVRLEVLDVSVQPDLRVGYVAGVGDFVPEALEQLGVAVEVLGPEDLASAPLDRFDTIITGVRAYLNRADLRAHNDRLLEWVKNGGVLIVQYNKFEFNGPPSDGRAGDFSSSPYAPFPVVVGRGRVTDETAPIRILAPDHPLFRNPNAIGEEDWKGWVQERGLYFLGDKDPRYRDLVSTQDPFPFNAGEKLGALVEARYGQGRWIYVGLGLWRQLPAGVPGSYRLLANLVSLGKGPDS